MALAGGTSFSTPSASILCPRDVRGELVGDGIYIGAGFRWLILRSGMVCCEFSDCILTTKVLYGIETNAPGFIAPEDEALASTRKNESYE